MIPLVTREEARRMDAAAVAAGTPSIRLMENAGVGAARILREEFAAETPGVVVVGGTGQNGGDAWVVARLLAHAGAKPRVVVVGDPATIAGDARVNFDALVNLGVVPMRFGPASTGAFDGPNRARVIVDGIFGTGLSRAVTGEAAAAVEAIARSGARVLALDVPSGIDANTGQVLGAAVRADVTATFGAAKRGLVQHPGAAHAGDVCVVDIGVTMPLDADADAGAALLEAKDIDDWLPRRAADTHKARAGHVAVLGGNDGTRGASVLAGVGAMRAGAGLVTLCVRAEPPAPPPEFMVRSIVVGAGAGAGSGASAREALLEFLRAKADVVVVGPGFGDDEFTAATLLALRDRSELPCVIDADALRVMARERSLLRWPAGRAVLTPHPGEAAALLGVTSDAVNSDRFGALDALVAATGCTVVLKGAGTVIAGPGTRRLVCLRGTPAMAVAGTGDVLAGAIAACWASGGGPVGGSAKKSGEALAGAASGVFLHAVAGEIAPAADRGMLASELAAAIPDALSRVREQAHGAP
jgi:hydroxyethylthiazole kinase-like uncharacterized protein yjeF